MMDWKRAALALLAAAAAAGALASVSSGTRDAAPLRIAVEGPLTGAQASNGMDMLRGVQLAVREVNARGGVLGRRVEIVKVNDKADSAAAKTVANAAIAKGVVAVIGPYNSSVGILNLPLYVKAGVVPVQLTSTDDTTGLGVTVQPKNSQISPVEAGYVAAVGGVKRVAMLVDPSAYTKGMADRMRSLLRKQGIAVTAVSFAEGKATYEAQVAKALASDPDLVYVSSYYPEGSKIAKALQASGTSTRCLMGLANVDPAFVQQAGLAPSRACRFSGVPEAAQLPSAGRYVAAYRAAFKRNPGVWGAFTYDSAKVLFVAMRRAGTASYAPVMSQLLALDGYRGATGSITIDPQTGNRVHVPVSILAVNAAGQFAVAR